MIRYLLAAVPLVAMAGVSGAAVEEGTVLAVTADTIKIQQGGVKTQTFQVSNELLNNTVPYYPCLSWGAKFTAVKKGTKVQLDCIVLDASLLCVWIHLDDPDDAGIVTAVGKNTITIRNDKGKTTTYKVAKDLADNSRPDGRYRTNYPSRFGEVMPGGRIEVDCFMEDGEIAITGIDVKK